MAHKTGIPLTGHYRDLCALYRLRVKAPPASRIDRGYRIFWTGTRPWRRLNHGQGVRLYTLREVEGWLDGYQARLELMEDAY